uniref:Uncharacterized protein n=1 Tax=Glossina pallidipes TaxID=7398 RepID=A0A1A9Z0S1_GLOPL
MLQRNVPEKYSCRARAAQFPSFHAIKDEEQMSLGQMGGCICRNVVIVSIVDIIITLEADNDIIPISIINIAVTVSITITVTVTIIIIILIATFVTYGVSESSDWIELRGFNIVSAILANTLK